MRKLILLFALAWPALSAWGNGYTYRASITIDNTKVSGVDDLTNFPVLISDTYDGTGGEPDLRDTGNGGGVQSSNGWDIRFETTSGAQLDHELETYTNTTGLIVAWVEVGTVDHDDNTVIYMFYGKSGLGATEENITGTWNSAYLGVWHLNETTGQHHDATSNDNDSTTVTVTTQGTATGQVDGADTFAGASNNRVTLPNIPLTTALTLQAWVYPTAFGSWAKILNKAHTSNVAPYMNYSLSNNDASPPKVRGEIAVSGTSCQILSTTALTLSTWTFAVFTWDGTNMNIYLDGSSDAAPVAQEGPIDTIAQVTEIGYNTVYVAQDWTGDIDEARISNVARSADWITTEYNNQNSPGTFYSMGSPGTSGGAARVYAAIVM